MASFALVALFLASPGAANIVNILAKTEGDLMKLKRMVRSSEHDFLSFPRTVNASALIYEPDETKLNELRQNLDKDHLKWDPVTYGHVTDEKKMQPNRPPRSNEVNVEEFLKTYHSYEEMVDYMKALAKQYPLFMSTFVIGKSSEQRDILGIKLSAPRNNGKSIVVECGIHAREWIAPSSCIFAFTEFLGYNEYFKYHMNPRNKDFPYDFYFIPSLNPDGYEYSRDFTQSDNKTVVKKHRLWRKTRRLTEGCPPKNKTNCCRGVDGNRNYPVYFGVGITSNKLCSNTYMGPKPLSEPESKALAKFVYTHRKNIIGYVSVHSYSQIVLYGHSSEEPDNPMPELADVKRVAEKMAREMTMQYANLYIPGTGEDILYAAGGGTTDFVIACGIPFAYTIELRGPQSDPRGFVLSEREIKPTATELHSALNRLSRELFAIEKKNKHNMESDLAAVKQTNPGIFDGTLLPKSLRLQWEREEEERKKSSRM